MRSSREHIGNFDRRITFQEAELTTNTANEEVRAWDDLETVPTMWAMVVESKGSEVLQSEQMDTVQPTTFRIRYRGDLDEEMRIVYKQHPYYIEGIMEVGRREYLDILTRIDKEEIIT